MLNERVGANLASLQDLYRALGENTTRLGEVRDSVERAVGGAVWAGPNAERFREAWEQLKPSIDGLAVAFADAQRDVRSQHNNLAAATGEGIQI